MNFPKDKTERLEGLINGRPKKIVIVTHTNPDGDAIGSALAWATILRRKGHEVTCIVPNRYPAFLDWLDEISSLVIFKSDAEKAVKKIREAEVIFCLDFNQIHRLEGLSEHIEANKTANCILLDHHLNPPPGFDVEFSYPESSSTSFLVYCLIEQLEGLDAITKTMAEQLYVGIMTDTGNFSFSFLTSELFRAVAVLVDKGIDIPYINRMVYHSFSAERLRLLGYTLNNMTVLKVGGEQVAYMTLSESELRKFQFRQGDSEGFVNYPLSIRDMALSAIFIETNKFIRISLRSRIDVDASKFASLYFEGGGHKNAAGGKSYLNMDETVARYKYAVKEFFGGK